MIERSVLVTILNTTEPNKDHFESVKLKADEIKLIGLGINQNGESKSSQLKLREKTNPPRHNRLVIAVGKNNAIAIAFVTGNSNLQFQHQQFEDAAILAIGEENVDKLFHGAIVSINAEKITKRLLVLYSSETPILRSNRLQIADPKACLTPELNGKITNKLKAQLYSPFTFEFKNGAWIDASLVH